MSAAVLILYNRPGAYRGAAADSAASDAGVLDQVEAVEQALHHLSLPSRRCPVERLTDLPAALGAAPETIVFNLVEALAEGTAAACTVPDLCRVYGKSCSGNGTDVLRLTLDKWRTKAMLEAVGVATPPGIVIAPGEMIDPTSLPLGPLIVKPAATDASEGIDGGAVGISASAPELAAAVAAVHRAFGQAALVEQMVGTRELNVSVVEIDGAVRVLPLAEIDFSAFGAGRPRVVDYAAKWDAASFAFHHTPRLIPAPVAPAFAEKVRSTVLKIWQVLGCRGYARVDLRFDETGTFHVLEVNANPDISPDAGFAAALAAAGIAYADFVAAMVGKGGGGQAVTVDRPPAPVAVDDVDIRPTTATDVEAIASFLAATGFFRADEVAVAREVMEAAVERGAEASGYHSWTAVLDGRPVGWLCFGPTACTVHTYDVFWIGVDAACQGRGLGRRLMAFAETAIARMGGRLIVVETSGRELYKPTRAFYLRLGYCQEACLRDFYGPGDDKVIFLKSV